MLVGLDGILRGGFQPPLFERMDSRSEVEPRRAGIFERHDDFRSRPSAWPTRRPGAAFRIAKNNVRFGAR